MSKNPYSVKASTTLSDLEKSKKAYLKTNSEVETNRFMDKYAALDTNTKKKIFDYLEENSLLNSSDSTLEPEDKEDGFNDLFQKFEMWGALHNSDSYATYDGGYYGKTEVIFFLTEDGVREYVEDIIKGTDESEDTALRYLRDVAGDNYEKIYEQWGMDITEADGMKVSLIKKNGLDKMASIVGMVKEAAGTGLGSYRRGKVLTDVKAVQAGQLLVFESHIFKAVNLVKVTETFADKFYGIFVKPDNPIEKSKASDEEFSVKADELEKGEWHIALEPAPSDVQPEVESAGEGGGSVPAEIMPVEESETSVGEEPAPVAEAVEEEVKEEAEIPMEKTEASKNAAKETAIQKSYEGAECPDCGESIPRSAMEGSECKNCGHVFHTESSSEGKEASKKTAHSVAMEKALDGLSAAYQQGNETSAVFQKAVRRLSEKYGIDGNTLEDTFLRRVKKNKEQYGDDEAMTGWASKKTATNPKGKVIEVDGHYECSTCGREWSAMMGDSEVPEYCPDCAPASKKTAEDASLRLKHGDTHFYTNPKHWLAIFLDSEGNLYSRKNDKVVIIPYNSQKQATAAADRFEAASDVTVFSVDRFGLGDSNDVRSYYSNKTIIEGTPSMSVKTVYDLLNKIEASKKIEKEDFMRESIDPYTGKDLEKIHKGLEKFYEGNLNVKEVQPGVYMPVTDQDRDLLREIGGESLTSLSVGKTDKFTMNYDEWLEKASEKGIGITSEELDEELGAEASKKTAIESPVRKTLDYGTEKKSDWEDRIINTKADLDAALKAVTAEGNQKFAIFWCKDGGALAYGTVRQEYNLVSEAIEEQDTNSGWLVVGYDINEDREEEVIDSHTNEKIPSKTASLGAKDVDKTAKPKKTRDEVLQEMNREQQEANLYTNISEKDIKDRMKKGCMEATADKYCGGFEQEYNAFKEGAVAVEALLRSNDLTLTELDPQTKNTLSSIAKKEVLSDIDLETLDMISDNYIDALASTVKKAWGEEPASICYPKDNAAEPLKKEDLITDDEKDLTNYASYNRQSATAPDSEEETVEEEAVKEPEYEFVNHEPESDEEAEDFFDATEAVTIGEDDKTAYYTGREICEVDDPQFLPDEIHEWMEKNKWYPNVIAYSDHGNPFCYSVEKIGSLGADKASIEGLGFVGSKESGVMSTLLSGIDTIASAPGGEGDDGSAYDLVDGRNTTGVDENMLEASVEEYLNGKATSFASLEDFAGFVDDVYGIKNASKQIENAWHSEDAQSIVSFIKQNAVKDAFKR